MGYKCLLTSQFKDVSWNLLPMAWVAEKSNSLARSMRVTLCDPWETFIVHLVYWEAEWTARKIHLLRFRENLTCTTAGRKQFLRVRLRSFENLLFAFDSSELLRIEIGPKSISTALKLRTQWIAIRKKLKRTLEAPKVNISLGRCVIAELTGCLCNCNESER